MRGQVVGIELAHVHGGGAGLLEGGDCVVEVVGASRAASTTVAPGASRCASSSPISLRPPKITASRPRAPCPSRCDYVLR